MTTDERALFTSAADAFVALVAHVPDTAWGDPGLGAWTVRDLTGHASRSLVTIETYLDNPPPPPDDERSSSVQYYLRVLGGSANPADIEARGRAAGAALGADPAAAVASLRDRVVDRLADTPDDRVVATPGGALTLVDYLPTRTFELVVHSIDLAAAVGVPDGQPDPAVARAVTLAGEIAAVRADARRTLAALTGRDSLPPGFSVV